MIPSRNQARYLKAALDSVLSQGYPQLELIVIDGGSTDQSVDVIRECSSRLTYWVSEADEGQYDAVTKGFARSTGDILGWLNSDDLHLPWTLWTVASIFGQLPEVEWISSQTSLAADNHGIPCRTHSRPGFSREAILEGRYRGRDGAYGCIQQESTFWRRRLWNVCGASIPNNYGLAGDFALWIKFAMQADLFGVPTPLSIFRFQSEQRSRDVERYESDVDGVLKDYPYSSKASVHRRIFIFGRGRSIPGALRLFRNACCYKGSCLRKIAPESAEGGTWLSETQSFL